MSSKRRGSFWMPLLAALLVAGCSGAGEPERPPGAEDVPDAREGVGGEDAGSVCAHDAPWVPEGPIRLAAGGRADATEVGALRWRAHPGCERFVIDLLADDGSPARSPGRVRAELLRDVGVVRISLLDVVRVVPAATDVRFDGELAHAAYVVRAEASNGVPAGPEVRALEVDLHLAGAAEAHVDLLDMPARVVVDLRPGGPPLPHPPATRPRVVVLEPRPGAATYPLRIIGYARTFEANVVARMERDGETAEEIFTTANDYIEAWGRYTLAFDRGETGPIVLHVGEYSAKDGTWEGVAIELEMR